jgi:hypothetical protein
VTGTAATGAPLALLTSATSVADPPGLSVAAVVSAAIVAALPTEDVDPLPGEAVAPALDFPLFGPLLPAQPATAITANIETMTC